MKSSDTLRVRLDQVRRISLVVGIVGLLAAAVFWVLHPEEFFRSYLLGYMYWIGLSLGSLSLLMLHHLVGGGWGLVIRRILEAATRTLPLMAVLFVPIALGINSLYEWARPEAAQDEILAHKAIYLNPTAFLARVGVYFTVWLLLSYLLNKRSLEQDRTGDPALSRRLQILSGPGLVLYVLTVTFASIDWVMSLEPHWFSTIYGLLYLVGFGLLTLAFCVIVLRRISGYEPLAPVVRDGHFHDLGNLMLAFVMLWAYLSFSQYLIVWSGNLPEEVPWYIHRLHGGWQYLALFLIIFHFAFPFVLLLSRSTKRKAVALSRLALAVLVLRIADLVFLIIPALSHGAGFNVAVSDVAVIIGIGGFWVTIFCNKLKDRPLLAVNDPLTQEALTGTEVLKHG